MYELIFDDQVYKDLERLNKSTYKRIVSTIKKKLTQDPVSFGKPLTGNLKGYYRLRIDDYRVIYKIENKKLIVFVIAVGARKDDVIYRIADKRRPS